jgi:signal transduction histidine kinase
MRWLLYLRLILLTAGTLLPFFWMMVILGYRRQRNFERVFFFLCLALTLFFGCSLLELNATLYYDVPPHALLRFAWTFLCLGLWFLPPLIMHLHAEYANLRGLLSARRSYAMRIVAAYLPVLFLSPMLLAALKPGATMDFGHPTRILGLLYQAYLVAAIVMAAIWQYRFAKAAPDAEQRAFHHAVLLLLASLALLLPVMFASARYFAPAASAFLSPGLLLLALLPFGLLISNVQRFNFLQIGRQRNLIYAVFGTFLALLYLSFVRRASLWLEPYLPPAASAALLLFLPIVFFEPLQRLVRQSLRQTAQGEVDRAQKLSGPISDVARLGDQEKLRTFCEQWIAEQLQLGAVRLTLFGPNAAPRLAEIKTGTGSESFEIRRGEHRMGTLQVQPFGAMVSGETYAAVELICEQLPAAFDLCRLIEEKLQLERELAERERLALVGQMAASISHNLKNPLGSIKTILQVQLENPDLPANLRKETQMVLDEINRLSARLNQLLQFSRPGVGATSGAQSCELSQVVETVANVLRHSAEERGITLQFIHGNGEVRAAVGEEAANDILSNVVLNAIEAVPDGGCVSLALRPGEGFCTVAVQDNGPGISTGDQAKVLQPFFTTKARGTGLGLAIVDRRLQEAGGSLEIRSPIANGCGTEIQLKFPVAPKEQAG